LSATSARASDSGDSEGFIDAITNASDEVADSNAAYREAVAIFLERLQAMDVRSRPSSPPAVNPLLSPKHF